MKAKEDTEKNLNILAEKNLVENERNFLLEIESLQLEIFRAKNSENQAHTQRDEALARAQELQENVQNAQIFHEKNTKNLQKERDEAHDKIGNLVKMEKELQEKIELFQEKSKKAIELVSHHGAPCSGHTGK